MAAGQRVVKILFRGEAEMARAHREVSAGMSKVKSAIGKAGAGLKSVALGAGIGAGLSIAEGIMSGLDGAKVSAKLAAQLGATGSYAQDLGDAAGRLYARGVVGSVEEAADAVKAAIQNGLTFEDATSAEIEAVAAKVSNLATVMGEDAGKVGAAISTMLKTGVAKSSEEAFDILQRGVENGANKAEDLLDTFTEYSTQFRKLGLSGPAAMGLISQGLKAGARDADTVADAIKEFSIRAIDGSKTTVAGFKSLGLSSKQMAADIAAGGPRATKALDATLDRLRAVKDPVKQAEIAVQLFGTKAEDLGAALFSLDPSKATEQMGNLAGAADKAGKTLEQNAGAKVEALKRKLQGGLVKALADTATWIEKNQGLVMTLVKVLGPIIAIIATVVAVTKIWTAVQAAFNIVAAANPYVLIALAIIALIAVIVLIATKTTWFQAIWEAVSGAVAAAAMWLWKSVFVPVGQGIWGVLKAIGGFFTWLWHIGVQVPVEAVAGVIRWLVEKAKESIAGWKAIIKAAGDAVETARAFIKGKVDAVVSVMKGLGGRIKSSLSNVADIISAPFKAAFNAVARFWNSTAGQLSFTAPKWVPGLGGKGFSLPKLPQLQHGGPAVAGRRYLVGERGPEVLEMGSQSGHVTSNADLGGETHVHVYLGDRPVEGIVERVVVKGNRALRRGLAGAR